MQAQVVQWHSDEGVRVALAVTGRTRIRLVISDYPVHVVSVPLSDARYMVPQDYPVARAARKILAFGKHGNMTAGARALVKEVA